MKLKVRRKFAAAHYLKGYDGPCSNMHGHTWEVLVTFNILGLDKIGISADFGVVKRIIEKELPDHQIVNDWMVNPVTVAINPTAEIISSLLFRKINEAVKAIMTLELYSVEVFESEDCSAEFTMEDFDEKSKQN